MINGPTQWDYTNLCEVATDWFNSGIIGLFRISYTKRFVFSDPNTIVPQVSSGGTSHTTLQGTNVSHLGKLKIIFKSAIGMGYLTSQEGSRLLKKTVGFLPLQLFMPSGQGHGCDACPLGGWHRKRLTAQRATWRLLGFCSVSGEGSLRGGDNLKKHKN